MIGGPAMSFTAILFMRATLFQQGALNAMQLMTALLGGQLGDALGIRLILAVRAGGTLLLAKALALSPVRRLKEAESC